MTTRNKIEANQKIFARLDRFCSARAHDLQNAGTARYVATEPSERKFLTHATYVRALLQSSSRAIQQLDFEGKTFILTAGFETLEIPAGFEQEDLNGAMLTTLLAESEIRPSAAPLRVREIVEVGQIGQAGYVGHDPEQIRSLYPVIQAFSSERLDPGGSEGIFLLFCLGDRRRSEHWIEDSLARTLETLSGMKAETLPLTSICKAVLDPDPSSLYLALYKALEGLYAREKTIQLTSALGVERDWVEVAEVLESILGWRPREEGSLESLLSRVTQSTLRLVLDSFSADVPVGAKLYMSATRRIYALRNSLVHYRPFLQSRHPLQLNWPMLCEGMTLVVLEILASDTPLASRT